MDLFIAFAGGVVNKVYDDLYDNKLTENQTILESLKGLHWVALTSLRDANFIAFLYLFCLANYFVFPASFSEPYELSTLIVSPILLLMNVFSVPPFLDIVALGILCSSVAIEPSWFPVEYSYHKLISRIGCIISSIIGFSVLYSFGGSESMQRITMYSLGYFVTSSLFQAYLLWKKNESVSVEE
jgi:hypothetical protein